MTKTHWKKLTNPNYIGSYALDPNEERIVTIEKVVRETVKDQNGKEEECTVAHLKGEKPLILNKTNCKIITKVYGTPYIEEWAGKQIKLYVTQVKAFGDTVDALRIRQEKPVQKKPDLRPDHPKWDQAKQAIAYGNATIEQIKKHYSISATNEKNLIT
jgi:hypothetical protein